VTSEISRKKFLQVGGGAIAAGSLASFLAACGGGGSSSGDSGMLKFSNDKITWKDWFVETGRLAERAGAIGWKPTEYSDTTTYQAAIKTTGNTPKVPDMFSWWSGWLMKELVDASMLADVSSIWEREGSAYSDGLKEAFTFDGKQYGVPLNVAYWPTFYNKRVFREQGLEVPTTWDEFTAVCDRLKSAGITPLGATIEARFPAFVYFQEFLVRTSPQLYRDLMAGRAKYTDPEVVDVMNLWGDLIRRGYFSDPSAVSIGTGANNFPQYFKPGRIAMVTFGGWLEPTLVEAGMRPGEDYGAFVMPNIEADAGNNLIYETGPLCVAQNGQRKDDTMKAVGWWASRDGQRAWIDASGFASARSDVASANPVDQEIDRTITDGRFQLLNRYWEATPHEIVEVGVDQLAKFMLDPGDPKPILETIQKQADTTWAAVGSGS
jgi:ABC-type glycerol-3-phosphate transport system substrate-binding protein